MQEIKKWKQPKTPRKKWNERVLLVFFLGVEHLLLLQFLLSVFICAFFFCWLNFFRGVAALFSQGEKGEGSETRIARYCVINWLRTDTPHITLGVF